MIRMALSTPSYPTGDFEASRLPSWSPRSLAVNFWDYTRNDSSYCLVLELVRRPIFLTDFHIEPWGIDCDLGDSIILALQVEKTHNTGVVIRGSDILIECNSGIIGFSNEFDPRIQKSLARSATIGTSILALGIARESAVTQAEITGEPSGAIAVASPSSPIKINTMDSRFVIRLVL